MANSDHMKSKLDNFAESFPLQEVGTSIIAVDTLSGPKNVLFTYDDGPEPPGTYEVLNALAANHTTATFFVLLSRTARNPTIVKEILSQGHEIALHGPDHKSLQNMSSNEVLSRTKEAKLKLEDLTGQSVRWYRPPYGHQTSESWSGIVNAGLIPVLWKVECKDWESARSDDYEQYLSEVREMEIPGSVIVAHDSYASLIDGVDDGPSPILDRGRLTKLILDICREKGFVGCSLKDALATGQPILSKWFR